MDTRIPKENPEPDDVGLAALHEKASGAEALDLLDRAIYDPIYGTVGAYTDNQDLKSRKPFRRWHEAIIDDMLANPIDTLEVRGKRLGYSGSYLSIIMNSDMFKAHYEARRKAYTELVGDSLTSKLTRAADKSLDHILTKLDEKRNSLSFKQLTDFALPVLDRLGYGAKDVSGVVLNVDNRRVTIGASVTQEQLSEARAALRMVESLKGETSEPPKKIELTSEPELEMVDASRSRSDDG